MDLAGRSLAQYRLVEKLGEGGMGAVFRAEDTRLGRQVALKLLSAPSLADPRARERLLAEARAVAALEHPHICLLYEFGEAAGQPFLAMQLVEGETLRQALRQGPLSEARTRAIVAAVASALGAAHGRGILHRDVKSENVLLGRDGGIKLSDFGIARHAGGQNLTAAHTLVGSPAYAAPEIVAGAEPSAASDQFSLAVVAYECLTGALPFAGESLAAVLYAITNLEPESPSRRRPGLDRAWDEALRQALAKDPQRRFPSVSEFAKALPAEPAPPASAKKPKTEPPSLAVLYFENLSNDPDSEYFCAGITEDILTDLSKISGLRVASRNAVARFKGQAVDIPRAAVELGVGTVLEGSVRRAGNRVRISAQLINARDGFHVWAERYDRTLDDVFAVQEDIARAIAAALRGALTPQEAAELHRDRPAAATAYDLYLKGRGHYRQYTHEENLRALECFDQAVALDPTYALAWAGIADACGQMHDKAYDMDPQWIERGAAAARRAIELGPRIPEGHKAHALIEVVRGNREEAMRALRQALAVDPRFTPALSNLGLSLELEGDLAGAERCIRRAIELDPADAYLGFMLAVTLSESRRFEECIQETHRFQSLGTGSFHQTAAHWERVHALACLGDLDAARRELEEARKAGLGALDCEAIETFLVAVAGEAGRTRDGVRRLSGRIGGFIGPWFLVAAAAAVGDAAGAVRLLAGAEEAGIEWARIHAVLRVRPWVERIHDSAEFRAWIGERGQRIVWPLEAPPLTAEQRARFTDYSEASGLPQGDGIP